jgi:hypothetical protein
VEAFRYQLASARSLPTRCSAVKPHDASRFPRRSRPEAIDAGCRDLVDEICRTTQSKICCFPIGLIASGIMGRIAIERWFPLAKGSQGIPLLAMYYTAFILLGTGVMLPFKKVTRGISIGIAVAILSTPLFFVDR